LALLEKAYPRPRIALRFKTPLELLVATILSAQCTDVRVNSVTEDLFRAYRTARDYAAADVQKFEEAVRSTGFYRNKTKNILAAARKIIADFGGGVPDTMEALLTLSGVARKTANVVLHGAFGKNEGIAVDTHVLRVSRRLGLTRHDDPVKVEQDLMGLCARSVWGVLSLRLIAHGRRVCQARAPKCGECVLNALCPSRIG
jgi:endonuclease-3